MAREIAKEAVEAAKVIYNSLADEESKRVFQGKMLYAITEDDRYWYDILNYHNQGTLRKLRDLAGNDKKVIIYGAGENCRHAMAICESMGVQIFCICDRDEEKQRKGFWGKRVISAEELLREHMDATVVISTIRYCKEVEEFLLKYFKKNSVINISGDEVKKIVNTQYFPEDILTFEDGEVFVDGGCYDFETSKLLMEHCEVKWIYAFEPDKMNVDKVKDTIENIGLQNVTVFEKGLWNQEESLYFNATGDILSHVVFEGEEENKIDVVALDEAISEKVTYIKMDIEGSELKALEGAKNLIQKYKPKLAICVYHKPEDIVDIPSYIKKLVPEYRLFMRHHSWTPSETVLYATL